MSAPEIPLSISELRRYGRHLNLPSFGEAGQRKLKASSALLVGAGGLGSPVAMYLAAAGIGRLGLVDFDQVDASNLQRQILHGTRDIGRPKLESARDRLHDINPHVQIDLHPVRLSSENALELIRDYDVVADGTDNFPTRYLVNDACVLAGVPNVYASIFRFEGQASVFATTDGPCYRCLYEAPPPPGLVPSCAEGGVLGVLPGLVGTIQATEVIKFLTGIGELLVGRLLLIDALSMQFRTLKLQRNPACPVCGDHPTQTTLIDYEAFCGITTENGSDAMTVGVPEIDVQTFKTRIEKDKPPFVLDVRKPYEYRIANLGAQLIPVDELEARLDELSPFRHAEIVVHCRSGARSARAVKILLQNGFPNAVNLKGGILAWREQIDPTLEAY